MSLFFSIIIPTFNSNRTIKDSLFSVLNQTFLNFEILIIDGLSTDDTLEIVREFSDNRIRLFSDSDCGVYDAMNKSLSLAKGDWLYFFGSDDILYNSTVLEEVYYKILTTNNPIVYGNVLINGNTSWAKHGQIYAGNFSKFRLTEGNICQQAIFYNRHFLISNNLNFDLKYPISADWDFNLKCRRISKFSYVDLIIAEFNSGGLSSFGCDEFPLVIKEKYSDMIRPFWQKRIIFHFKNRNKLLKRVKKYILKCF